MNKNLPVYDRVLSPKQAAAIADVTRKELRRWEREGKVSALKTATGAHRRYLESEVMAAAMRRKPYVATPWAHRHRTVNTPGEFHEKPDRIDGRREA
jgi:hypothetical protein